MNRARRTAWFGYKHGEYVDFDIDEALGMQKGIPAYQYEIAKELAL